MLSHLFRTFRLHLASAVLADDYFIYCVWELRDLHVHVDVCEIFHYCYVHVILLMFVHIC